MSSTPEETRPGGPPRRDVRGRVLIVTSSVGAGHNSVTRSLMEGFARSAPRVELRRIDTMDFASWAFRAYYAGGFALSMAHFPRAYGVGFHLSNHPQRSGRSLVEQPRLWVERHAMRRLLRSALDFQPDLILNTHFLAPPVFADAMRVGKLRCPQVVVVTDIEVHRAWYSRRVAHWFVPSDHSAEPLRRWGVGDERITVSGIPVHAKWTRPLDRRRVLADWRLPDDRPLLILSGGTEFVCVPVVRVTRAVLGACPEAHLIPLSGRDRRLLARLKAMPEAGSRVTPVGFTDRLHELVEVSSLMLTKAGGVTTAECLAKGKPMVIMNPVPGHEGGNAAYLAGQGAAVVARGRRAIVANVQALLGDRVRLETMAGAAKRLHRPGVEIVVNLVCRMLASSAAGPS